MNAGDFETFRDSIQRLGGMVRIAPEDQATLDAAAAAFQQLPRVSIASVAKLVKINPDWIPVLGLCVRLSGEQLKGILKQQFATESLANEVLGPRRSNGAL